MIRWVGEKRMPLALTLSGWMIGIPIFSDVGYVILNPLVHSAAIRSGLNMSVMSTGLDRRDAADARDGPADARARSPPWRSCTPTWDA